MSTLKVNDIIEATSGGGKAHVARAWANLNGAGTVSIRGDKGVSSITDNAVGKYTVSLDNSMSNANYAPIISTAEDSYYAIVGGLGNAGHTSSFSTSSYRVQCVFSSTFYDVDYIMTAVHGDLA